MIGYSITRNDLEKKIEAVKKGWLKRAAKRTAKFSKKGKYDETGPIWSEIKQAFMELQGGSKCAFCERKLEDIEYGKIEQDVEHFRPKSRVRKWKMSKFLAVELKRLGISVKTVPKTGGYYLLPYNVFNYSAVCKPCNSGLKKDYFPVSDAYDLSGNDPKTLLKEKPLLIYPIGDFDKDPEKLLDFHGASPRAVATTGLDRARALVTIEFFKLDDPTARKHLFRSRAQLICILYPQLLNLSGGVAPAVMSIATDIVDICLSSKNEHSNCARSFKKLFDTDPSEAAKIFEAVTIYLKSIS